MRINNIQSYNSKFSPSQKVEFAKNNNPVSFTGAAKESGKLTKWIIDNYILKFYKSGFAKKFVEKTSGPAWDKMPTHMAVAGSTLISAMYVVRTLGNDKLDEKKRKTLALNDCFTWGLSTAITYLADKKLSNWWNGVTTRFVANYMLNNPKARNTEILGEWEPKDLRKVMNNWFERVDPNNPEVKKIFSKIEKKAYTSIKEFNLDVLKNPELTTLINGMDVFKSLFIAGMIYRYVVPVLVMKPANIIGKKLHEKNDAKAQTQTQTQTLQQNQKTDNK